MSGGTTSYLEQLDRLLDACFAELEKMPDADVLAGESVQSVKERAMKRLERARFAAGRLRLAAAKEKQKTVTPLRAISTAVSPGDARRYITRVAQDREHTLAARDLAEMSDEDVLRLYQQIRELEAEDSKRDDDTGPAS